MERPQVAQPLPVRDGSVTVHMLRGKIVLKGKVYLFPGFEEFDFLVVKPRGSKSKNTKCGWEVYEMSTGYQIAQTYSGDGTCQQVIEMASTLLCSLGKQGFSKRLEEARKLLQTSATLRQTH